MEPTTTRLNFMPAVSMSSLAAFVAVAAAWQLAPRSRPLGLCRRERAEPGQPAQAVPLIGGLCIALGLLAARAAAALLDQTWDPGRALEDQLARWQGTLGFAPALAPELALASGLALGVIDDRAPGGLSAAVKLAGQLACGALLAAPALLAHPTSPAAWLLTLCLALLAAVATNALNTFDNADGCALGLASAGLLPLFPPAGAAALALLPFNLRRSDGRALFGWPLPRLFLGDGGAHLLGLLLLLEPRAWPALALPLFDLARVALERARAGVPIWRGDRRHLAHRLLRRGLAPPAVVLLLLAAASPSLVPAWIAGAWSLPLALLLGLASAALGGLLCGRSAAAHRTAQPESGNSIRAEPHKR
jgi:UDP-N-acetylmuramyl pentapeptide phosphotransferase/UDP-N-acetylglucosamine-1-phosphate transferase